MTEFEKFEQGLFYNAVQAGLPQRHLEASEICFDFNHIRPSNLERREELIRQLFAKVGKNCYIEPPLTCSYGFHMFVGDEFFANSNCLFMDDAKITFGNDVFIGPNCQFYTAHHPIHWKKRNSKLEKAIPITVGNNVWFGGSCVILPGVTIGSNVVIGAGSVVTRDIPDNVIAAGNPARVLRPITEEDLSEISDTKNRTP